MMKIAFVDNVFGYTANTALEKPLGGIQSAVCYLSQGLHARGCDVRLFNGVDKTVEVGGIPVYSVQKLPVRPLKECDVIIAVGSVNLVPGLRRIAGKDVVIYLWTGHAHDQPSVADLAQKDVLADLSGIIYVSHWQQQQYEMHFPLQSMPSVVLNYGMAPAFNNLFEKEGIIESKSTPPVIAYTSTPFRGLDHLLHCFPEIRQSVPGVTLNVYSSMQVYGVDSENDPYTRLYDQARQMPGVNYIGSIPQPELADAMKSVHALIYPNHFAETSCIAVIEALASGCAVVTSELGALPETTGGFGQLIPYGDDMQVYQQRFIQTTVEALKPREESKDQALEQRLRAQVDYANENYSWPSVVEQWIKYFS